MDNNIRINPLKYPNIKCECGCEIWNQGVILKRIPGIEVGAGTEDQILDLPIYYCSKCGTILDEYQKMYKMGKYAEEEKKSEETTKSGIILV